METRTYLYPVYVSGQYLTSEHLNETQDFLWEEEKATRYLLIGNGITHGMTADYVGTTVLQSITLSAGVASTIDGYIIDVTADTSLGITSTANIVYYTLADGSQYILDKTAFDAQQANLHPATSKDLTGYELFFTDTDPTKLPEDNKKLEVLSITTASAGSDYVLLAYVQITDLANNHCQQGDCNTKGIQRNFSVRYFLLKNDFLQLQNTASSIYPLCTVARIKNLSGATSTATLNQKSFDAWGISFKQLIPYFTTGSGMELKTIATNAFDANTNVALTNSISKLNQINSSVTAANCPQYYTAFASDLSVAINELVCYYNTYARNYPQYSANRIALTTVIGLLRSTGLDKFRYYFLSDIYLSEEAQCRNVLGSLFNRVLALIDNFILVANFNTKINTISNRPKQTPTIRGTDALLQNCAMPCYIDITGPNNSVLKYWHPKANSPGNVCSYYDTIARPEMASKLATTSWTNYNFFLMEGHIGMTKASAITNIQNLITEQGLPIQVIDCTYANSTKGTTTAEMKAQVVKQLQEWGKIIVRNKISLPLISKKFSDLIAALSNTATTGSPISREPKIRTGRLLPGKTTDEVFNDVFSYLGTIFPTKGRAELPGNTEIETAFDKERVQFVALETKPAYDTLLASYKTYKNGIVVNPPSAQLLLKDLPDLEYLAGTWRGGTFVLIHDGTTVLGDGCLPYYFNINKARVV